MMSELPGQIPRDDDLNKQQKNVASHMNSFGKELTKSDSSQHSTISASAGLEERSSNWINRTGLVDAKSSCVQNKFQLEDNGVINNVYNEEHLLHDNLTEPNDDTRIMGIKCNVSTPCEKSYIKSGTGTTIQKSPNISQDKKLSQTTQDVHRAPPPLHPPPPGSQNNKYNDTDNDEDVDDDDDDDDDGDSDENKRPLCEGDVVSKHREKKREDGRKESNEEVEDERRWAEKVLKDSKHNVSEGGVPRKHYQKGCMSETESHSEVTRMMQNSILGGSIRKSLGTEFEDTMEVSSVESLTWEERPITPISPDSQTEEAHFSRNESDCKPNPSENSFDLTASFQETDAQLSHISGFQYILDVPDQRDMLAPVELGTIVKCHIIKYTNGIVRNFCPIYYLYVMNENDVGMFFLAARKRFKCMRSSYVICMDSKDLSRSGSSYVAKLKANLVGTEYRLLCKRCNAEKSQRECKSEPMVKPLNEIAGIIYEYANILGMSNPETLTVLIPRLNSCQERMEIILDDKQEGLIERWRQHDEDDIIEMPSRKHWINEETFYGRSPEYSYKNFQLLCDDSIALQVGQMDKDLFFMDFRYPLCTLQAFAVALSSFDCK